ncbi:hypothetical protein MRX96_036150 [Rhipicephalus microplus]
MRTILFLTHALLLFPEACGFLSKPAWHSRVPLRNKATATPHRRWTGPAPEQRLPPPDRASVTELPSQQVPDASSQENVAPPELRRSTRI